VNKDFSGLLAMDAGQSGVRAQVIVDGETVASAELPQVRTNADVVPQLAQSAAAALALTGLPADSVQGLAIGTTGLNPAGRAGEVLDLVKPLGITRVALAHDSVTSYLGALHQEKGAVVAAGTGVVTLSCGEAAWARVDGWGNQLGDAGSGFWIGRAGLEMVMRAYDGRGPATALTGIVQADFPNLENAYLEIQSDPDWVARVAGYSKIVGGLADTDEVCGRIIDTAAAELANSVLTALRRVAEDKQLSTLVATQGKVFNSTRLHNHFGAIVHEQAPGVQFVKPLGDALDGATQLFDLFENSPLRPQVSFAVS
jgi:N-acetylglucosamine kinase-like BadF-type ATPase